MGHFTIVHGYINARGDFFEENIEVIATLSEEDSWPYLTRDLFVVPQPKHSYKGQVISFGTTYNGIEVDWEEWVTNFRPSCVDCTGTMPMSISRQNYGESITMCGRSSSLRK